MSVVVLVSSPLEAPRLLHWAALFGRARGQDVVALSTVVKPGEQVVREVELGGKTPDAGGAKAVVEAALSARSALPNLPRGEGDPPYEPGVSVFVLEGPNPTGAVLAALKTHEASLLLLGRQAKEARDDDSSAVHHLFKLAPCHTILIRPGADEAETAEKMLVPSAGGPHARVALELAAELAAASGGRVTALNIQTNLGEDAEAVADRVLEKAVARTASRHRDLIDTKVVLAGSVLEGVAAEAEGGIDLVLLGTSNKWFVRRILFRTLPEAMLAGPEGTSVAVVRRSIRLKARLGRATVRFLNATVPQMQRADRVALVERLQTSSRWNFDFAFLTCLSTLIAALGLVADNIAVVIGAMLVAPLMTPLIGAGLALVYGNLVFLRRTMRTVGAGFVVALFVGGLVGLVVWPETTDAMTSRGQPGTLDLVVAFASGLAAAYAIGRPGLSAALPGVAIAASLVPPIATTGLCLVTGEPAIAAGAALLFFTNMVAIVLGSSVSLYAAGIRSEHLHRRQEGWVRRLVILGFVLAALLVIPLSFWLARLAG